MRLYNGQPDRQLQAKLDADLAVRASLTRVGLNPVYFPVEESWTVFGPSHSKPVTGFHPTLRAAAQAAFKTLGGRVE